MHERAHMTLLAWPYPGRDRLPVGLIARLDAAGLLPASDEPTGRQHLSGDRAVVLAGSADSGPILARERAPQCIARVEVITGLVMAGLHVYAGRVPAGGYCAVWEYHPPGEPTEPARHRCCERDQPPHHTERWREGDEATECELNRWKRLMLGSPSGVPAPVLLAAH